MTEAIIGADLQVTLLSGEAWIAGTDGIVAVFIVSASTLASLQRAVNSHESLIANTGPINTLSVTRALVGAGANRAISSSVSKLTVASGVVANTLAIAVSWTAAN